VSGPVGVQTGIHETSGPDVIGIGRGARRCYGLLAAAALSGGIILQIPQVWAGSGSLSLSQNQFAEARDLVGQDTADFAGVSVNRTSQIAFIHVVSSRLGTPMAQSVLAQLEEIAASDDGTAKVWGYSIVDVAHSLAELNATQAEITTKQPWASDSAPYLSVWYVDPAVNAVHVDVTGITSVLSADVSEFGDRVRLGVQERPTAVTRQIDSPPWYGGDAIGSSLGVQTCTGGFAVQRRSNGHNGMLTAGHCYGLGTTVFQNDSTMGSVTWRVYGASSYDAEFIDTSSANQVFTSLSVHVNVDSFWSSLGNSDPVCTDGFVSGQNCNAVIYVTNTCVVYQDGQRVCHLDEATSTNGSWIVRVGDSGGPVYSYAGDGGVFAEGTISGETGHGTGSTTMFFTPFGLDLNSTFRLLCSPSCS
jgi:hypothetical protein